MRILSLALCLALGVNLYGQTKPIQLEDIWKYYRFYAPGVAGLESMNDGEHYTTMDNMKNGSAIVKYSYGSGDQVDVVLSNEDFNTAVGNTIPMEGYEFSADESKLLIATETESIYRHSTRARFYVYDLNEKSAKLLNDQKVRYATFSPAGNKVAYVLDNNLFISDMESGQTTQVTDDGKRNHIINGAVDWVYEEEFSFSSGFYWSEEGNYIAYYKFDESMVPEFSMDVYGSGLYPEQDVFKYPKAGEANATVQAWIYDVNSGESKQVLQDAEYEYIPRMKWTRNDEELCVFTMNRLQNDLKLNKVNAKSGESSLWYQETDAAYIEISDDIRFSEGR